MECFGTKLLITSAENADIEMRIIPDESDKELVSFGFSYKGNEIALVEDKDEYTFCVDKEDLTILIGYLQAVQSLMK